MRLLLSSAFVVGGLSLMGCSSSGKTGAPSAASGGGSGDAGPSSSGGGGAGGSAGSTSSSDAGASDAGAAPKAGYILVTSHATEVATVFTNSVFAGFYDGPGNSFGKGCTREVTGKCAVLLCDYANGGDQAPPPGAPESAGTLMVGGTTPAFSLPYDTAAKQYAAVPVVPTDKLLFAGGDVITFTAAGGDVAAFTDSLVAPAPLTVTAPVLPSGAYSVDTSKDLAFTWTGTSAGMLSFNVRTATTSGATVVGGSLVSCQFAASDLTGTIPAILLQKLKKTDATTTGLISTDLSNAKEAVAGDHSIHLAVGSVATKPDGKTAYAASQVTVL